MAYGIKYILPFKNRFQQDIWRAEILEKDYADSTITVLTGAETPFTAEYTGGDTDILEPIKAVELTMSFITDNSVSVTSVFYTGNADIQFTETVDNNFIIIHDQVSDLGIEAGMSIVVDGDTYTINDVLFVGFSGLLYLDVNEAIPGGSTLLGEDFTVYNSEPLGIEAFFTDDDEKYRIDFYWQSLEDGTGTEQLIHRCFLIPYGVSEAITDQKHVIVLKATDNVALLKNVTLVDARPDDYNNVFSLWDYVRESLQETGLYSAADADSLPLILYNNLFENSIDDRSGDLTNDPFKQLILQSGVFQHDDNTYDDLYTVLSKILKCFNAQLLQVLGAWVVVRIPEYKFFDGAIPGTELTYSGGEVETAVTLNSIVNIDRTGDVVPVKEDQIKTLQSPVRLVRNTFNYNQSALIKQSDLQIDADAVPYDTETIGDYRYDRYSLATYFPDWIQRGSDASYLEIQTNISVTPEQEEGRYIVSPGVDSVKSGVQFNPVAVSAGDKIDFTLQWRTNADTDDTLRFWVRFLLIRTNDTYYALSDETGTGSDRFRWAGPNDADFWDSSTGIRREYSDTDDADTTEWIEWALYPSPFSTDAVPPMPTDGMLLIQCFAANVGTTGNEMIFWKDITLNITSFANSSVQIVGHVHTDTGNILAKAIEENEIEIDDSPRNPIAGTLFTNELSNFEYTDTNTGEETDILPQYVTRTRVWHRGTASEELRLGNIITQERLELKYTRRLIIDGSFKNLRYGSNFVSMLSLFTFGWLPGKYFTPASINIDYMAGTFTARLIEIYDDNDSLSDEYNFKFLYKID